VTAEPVVVEFGGCTFTFSESEGENPLYLSVVNINISTALRSGAWAAQVSASYTPHKEDNGIRVAVRVK
jgi:hypothetical protein